jgi:hypothetical protein
MDYLAVSKIARDPARVRSEAKVLAETLGKNLSRWQRKFLDSLQDTGVLDSKFWEAFDDLQTRCSRKQVVGGYRAYDLLQKLYHARADLNDEKAEEFIDDMLAYGPNVAPSRGQWNYIFALCRRLDIIQDEYISYE